MKFIKFIGEDRWRGFLCDHLIRSDKFKRLKPTTYHIHDSDFDGLKIRHSYSYVTEQMLNDMPIILLEDACYPEELILMDGTHRLAAAYDMDLIFIPAIQVPSEIWLPFVTVPIYDEAGRLNTQFSMPEIKMLVYVESHISRERLQVLRSKENKDFAVEKRYRPTNAGSVLFGKEL